MVCPKNLPSKHYHSTLGLWPLLYIPSTIHNEQFHWIKMVQPNHIKFNVGTLFVHWKSNQRPELIRDCATAISVSVNDVNIPFGVQVALPDVVAEIWNICLMLRFYK